MVSPSIGVHPGSPMLDQDLAHDVVSELRSLLEAQKSFAARLDANLDSLLRRADTAAVQNLSRADELIAGLRELSVERQQYLAENGALQEQLRALEQQLLEAHEKQSVSDAQCGELTAAGARLEHENQILHSEQQRLRRELTSLRHDVSLKEAYLVEVRRQAATTADERLGAADGVARELEAQAHHLRQQLAHSRAEVAALNVTLKLPRYMAADRLNAWLLRLRPVHTALKALATRKSAVPAVPAPGGAPDPSISG